jgi:hypothetical protein
MMPGILASFGAPHSRWTHATNVVTTTSIALEPVALCPRWLLHRGRQINRVVADAFVPVVVMQSRVQHQGLHPVFPLLRGCAGGSKGSAAGGFRPVGRPGKAAGPAQTRCDQCFFQFPDQRAAKLGPGPGACRGKGGSRDAWAASPTGVQRQVGGCRWTRTSSPSCAPDRTPPRGGPGAMASSGQVAAGRRPAPDPRPHRRPARRRGHSAAPSSRPA